MGSDRVNVRTAVYIKAERFTPSGDTNLVWQVRHLVAVKNHSDRLAALQRWYREGGIMVMGYELYRILSLAPKTNDEASRKELKRILVDPGWITQEGHHLTQVWSRMSFHTLCSVCLFRSGLCGVRRGPHAAQQRFQYFQSFECNKDEEEGGANGDTAAKQPGRV